MTAAPVIVDTKVVVAGLLTHRKTSPVARILDAMLGSRLRLVISQALLTEYRDVLVRPKLRQLHGWTSAGIDTVLVDLAHRAIVMKPVATTAAPAHHGRQAVARGCGHARAGRHAAGIRRTARPCRLT